MNLNVHSKSLTEKTKNILFNNDQQSEYNNFHELENSTTFLNINNNPHH